MAAQVPHLDTIPMRSITVHAATQWRATCDQLAIRDMAATLNDEQPLPPIDLFEDTDGQRYIGDGHHRYHAHVLAGSPEIAANIYRGTETDAFLHGIRTNVRNTTVRVGAADLEHATYALIERGLDKGKDAFIGKLLRVSDEQVAKWRALAAKAQATAPSGKVGGKRAGAGRKPVVAEGEIQTGQQEDAPRLIVDSAPKKRLGGKDTESRIARLKRDNPEIAARLEAGEFTSVAEAERAAGTFKPRKPADPVKHATKRATKVLARLPAETAAQVARAFVEPAADDTADALGPAAAPEVMRERVAEAKALKARMMAPKLADVTSVDITVPEDPERAARIAATLAEFRMRIGLHVRAERIEIAHQLLAEVSQ